jgi:tripartite-type tricarboxylate transporter receptor subunit TctC
VTGSGRFFGLPDTPTTSESAVPGYVVISWQAIVGPAGLPDAIVSRLNAEIGRILQDPATVERLHAIGNEPRHSTPEELKARMIADIAKWTAVVDSANFERI